MAPELRGNIKQWVFYSILKMRYTSFLKKQAGQWNKTHEYSDIVWWCWLQGEENAPLVCKACLASLRAQLHGKRIIILTKENLWKYADFPEYIKTKYEKGIISHAHFSDLLRIQLLAEHGGTWIDSTVFCTGFPEYIFNTPLFAYKEKERGAPAIQASSWLLSCEKNNPIIRLTRDLLFLYWKKHTYLYHYFLLHFFFAMATEKYREDWDCVPFFSNLPPHILQRELFNPYSKERFSQIARMSDIHKLTHKFDESKNTRGTFLEYILKQGESICRN
ncbi:MAG: capsular polysaccharide synthesis protein [Bacteroides sp.]|nr:capsular polysaccharide synthesis protein [Prevotella sp.]MCM1407866.1 capsular polysaccharide synthesis protein [Treponema brennaborense]MCM1469608.1 capsular polysaccharide synthesis protein [Bacteroides sp.]